MTISRRALFMVIGVIAGFVVVVGIWWVIRPTKSDEEQIIDLFLQVEQAVESKSVGGVMHHIAEDYSDGTHTKRDLQRLAIGTFRETAPFNVKVSTLRVLEITGRQAHAELDVEFWVGASAEPAFQLLTISVELEKRGSRWLVTGAKGWERAAAAL